jgi:hypothetical protein
MLGVPAIDIPSRVSAASPKESSSVVLTPTASAMDPTRKINKDTSAEKTEAQRPAFWSLIPKSPDSHRGSVGRKVKIPTYSKKVAR